MIDLSRDTEALATRVAEAEGLSVDETVRRALEVRVQTVAKTPRDISLSSGIVASRYAAIERAVQAMSALPDLDPRSAKEIMDDLDPL